MPDYWLKTEDVCRATDIHRNTLARYSALGLVPQPKIVSDGMGRHGLWPSWVVERIHRLQHMQQQGFSLDALRVALDRDPVAEAQARTCAKDVLLLWIERNSAGPTLFETYVKEVQTVARQLRLKSEHVALIGYATHWFFHQTLHFLYEGFAPLLVSNGSVAAVIQEPALLPVLQRNLFKLSYGDVDSDSERASALVVIQLVPILRRLWVERPDVGVGPIPMPRLTPSRTVREVVPSREQPMMVSWIDGASWKMQTFETVEYDYALHTNVSDSPEERGLPVVVVNSASVRPVLLLSSQDSQTDNAKPNTAKRTPKKMTKKRGRK